MKHRIRRSMGFPGSGVVVHHADIEADSREEALEKARQPGCTWRWIDRYDVAKKKFVEYEYLYPLEDE